MMRDILNLKKNEQTPFYLRLIDLLSFIYTKAGVNYSQMRLILDVKMKMDGRKEAGLGGMETGSRSDKEKNQFFSSLWVYSLVSLFLLVIFAYDNWVFQYTVYFSFLFVMTFSTMLANFSGILLDTKDATLIGTKPVDRRTLGAAKATHVGIYLLAFTLAVGAPVMVFTFVRNGLVAGVLVFFLSLLAALWCLGLALLVYATVLKRFSGERLKNIIAYSQISLSIFMIIGYYAVAQIFQVIDPENLLVEMNLTLAHSVLFPMWFVAPFGLLQEGWSLTYAIYTGLLLVGSGLLFVLYNWSTDKIESNLQKMDSSDENISSRSMLERLSGQLVCFDPLERAYYHFGWQLTKTEREFKTRLYPSIASSLVFPLVMTYNNLTAIEPGMDPGPANFLYLPYFTLLLIPVLAVSIQFSKHYKGSWVFELTPEPARAPFLRAVTKAMLIKILLPLYAALALVVLFFTGIGYLVQMLNGLLVFSLILYIETKRSVKSLPFSKKYSASQANLGCMATVIFLIPVFIVSVIMIVSQLFIPYAQWGILLLLTGLNIRWMKKGFSK
ncbi:hypothetical protein ADIAL_1807 [Alkalibacterium sp. AK22]|uniref:hypothetical protein n=1 Tax=Alkalibacterium sp. AK22 TaxID=1229520 RepID=UPI0004481E2A|nr:hypothetical protein [Alkalibacterium sp. AK22]EXJ22692.1 hypothetical protein ADIAL_1807 [Alkalibacterium sp. AK22]